VSWTCLDGSGASCTSLMLSCMPQCLSLPTFTAQSLPSASQPYMFTATVSSVTTPSAQSSSVATTIYVMPLVSNCNLPSVFIYPVPKRINSITDASAQVVLYGSVASTSSGTLVNGWAEVNSTESLTLQLAPGAVATGINLILATSLLGAGNTYTFQLTSTITCGSTLSTSGFAQVSFEVNSGPVGGALDVSPDVGQVGFTSFSLEASLFEDPEGDLPISYSFDVG